MRWIVAGMAHLVACGGPPEEAAPEVVLLGPEDVAVVVEEPIAVGPTISGNLEPAREATLQAEAGGSVLAVGAEVGQAVGRGAILARIDDVAAREEVAAARASVISLEADLTVAQREVERTTALVGIGGLAARDLETAQNQVTQLEAQLQQARAQLATARDRLDASYVVAPFDGTVSAREVSEGDVVAVGAPLFTVIDLSSLRLEAAVPIAALGQIFPGTRVVFDVRGLPDRTFVGRIELVAPAVDPATGQIPILAAIPNPEGVLIGGLFAEGRVATELHDGLVAPADAVDLLAHPPTVVRVRGDVTERVVVSVGLVDEETETVELTSGVVVGDLLLLGAARDTPPGTRVQLPPELGGGDGGA